MNYAALTELDRFRIKALVVGAGGFHGLPLLYSALPESQPFVVLGVVATAVWVFASWLALSRWYSFHCPSCGASFFKASSLGLKFFFRSPYSNRCAACGFVLPKT